MKQIRYIVPLMLFVALVLGQGAFAESKSKSAKLNSYHMRQAKALSMTEEQIEKYTQIVNAKYAADKQWKAEHGEAYKQAKEAYTAAKKSGDKEATKKAYAAYKEAKKGLSNAGSAYSKAFSELLTPEQTETLESMRLADSVNRYIKKVDATKEQQAKVKELAKAEGAKLAELKSTDKKAYGKVKNDFKMKMVDEVLTEEQKAKLPKAKSAKKIKSPKKEKASKEEKQEDTEE